MLLTPITHPRSAFTWSPSAGMLTAEASDFVILAARLWDDACDIGFAILGTDGKPVLFSLADSQRDREGDLMYEDFAPVDPDRGGGIVVRIFND